MKSTCGAISASVRGPGARHQFGHRAALRQLHRVPRDVTAAVPVEDRDDRRMRELRRELGFATEAPDDALVARDVRVQQLERDLAAERQIAHAPHGSERAGAERGEHFVVVGERPAETHFGRFARRAAARLVAGEHEHRAAADDAVHRAKHRRQRRKSPRGIRCSARSMTFDTAGGASGRSSCSGGTSSRGGVSPVSIAKQIAASCHWSLTASAPTCRRDHSLGNGMRRMSGDRPVGNLVERHCPLPADEPETAHRRRPHRVGRHRTVHPAEVVEVAQRRADLAHDAQHAGNVVGAHAAQTRADGFAGDPATQVSGAAAALGERRPVVVCRGHRGMVAVRERRASASSHAWCAVGRAYERQRAAERVDDFLVMTVLRVQSSAPQLQPGGSCQSRKCAGSSCVRVYSPTSLSFISKVNVAYHIFDSDRICSAAAANSGTSEISGSTVTSTVFTDGGAPFGDRAEAIDGI